MAAAGIVYINKLVNEKWEIIPLAVKTDLFSNIWYDSKGIISRFTYNYEKEGELFEEEYFGIEVTLSKSNSIGYRYLNIKDYRNYAFEKSKLNNNDTNELELDQIDKLWLNIRRFYNNDFIEAGSLDIIKIHRLKKSYITDNPIQYCWETIQWLKGEFNIQLDSENNIIVPIDIIDTQLNCNTLEGYSLNFYNNYLAKLTNNELDGDKQQLLDIIGLISQLIKNVGNEIFSTFSYFSLTDFLNSFGTQFNSIIDIFDAQQQNFVTGETLKKYNDFYDYYKQLKSYCDDKILTLSIIENGTNLDKTVELLTGLHSNILIKVSIVRRLEVLKYMVNKKLKTGTEEFFSKILEGISNYVVSTSYAGQISKKTGLSTSEKMKQYEELVVKLCTAFNESHFAPYPDNPEKSYIDVFLEGLLEGIYYIDYGIYKTENITLYEALYERMSNSWNITENIIHLSNWVFNTNYKANYSKGAFVQAIYGLWVFSKYNPYDPITSNLKPNIIGFKKIPNAFARDKYGDYILDENGNKKQAVEFNYDPNLPENQTLFKYTHEVGYYRKNHKNIFGEYWEDRYDHFNEPYAEDCTPLIMTYESNKSLGVFKNNFNFEFKGNKILAKIKKLYTTVSGLGEVQTVERIYGKYDIFQPIALISPEKITDSKVSVLSEDGNEVNIGGNNINSFTPVFVLKYIDDANDRDAAETMIGYSVDVVLTFTGIGNISKLRYLRYGTGVAEGVGLFTRQGLSIFIGALDFTAGVLGFLDNLVDCDPNSANYEFCKSVKGFVQVLQIVSLSATSVDSLQLVMLRIKAKKVSIAAGSTSSEVQEIKQAIQARFNQMSNDAVNSSKAAENIAYMSIIPISPQVIKNIRIKITKRINASTFKLQASYTDSVLQDFITLCKQDLAQTEKFIVDMVFIAQRKGKRINPQELTKQAKWHVYEIDSRGFGAGFSNLNMYKQFCNNFKNQFIQNIDELESGLVKFFVDADFVVQGSAARTWKNGDPVPSGNNLNFKPIKEADDIDIGIAIEPHLYDDFRDELKDTLNKIISNNEGTELAENLEVVIDKINGNPEKLLYLEVFKVIPSGNSKFVDELRSACKNFTNFESSQINFAVIKKYSNADNLPNVPFKY